MTDPIATLNAPWHDTLAAGDIVSFRFPYPDAPHAERARPCLVVDVDPIGGEAVVVYGTSRWTDANRGQELHVTGPDAALASLDRPTRFVGARRVRVALDSPRFIVSSTRGTPVVGRLAGTARGHLDRLKRSPTPARRARGVRRARPRKRQQAGIMQESVA